MCGQRREEEIDLATGVLLQRSFSDRCVVLIYVNIHLQDQPKLQQ